MRAVLRLSIAVAAVGLTLGGAPANAQTDPPAAANTTAPETVGPRELQNFSLEGTVTRPAETTPEVRAPAPATRPPPPARTVEAPAGNRTSTAAASPPAASGEASAPPPMRVAEAGPRPEAAPQGPSLSSITVPLPPPSTDPVDTGGAQVSAAAAPFDTDSDPSGGLAAQQSLSLWPWLLAAMALGAGAAFLLWRRNSREEAFAGGPRVDAFVAPPQPAPRPRAPAPPPPPPAPPVTAPKATGIVSTRLRPWIDIEFRPLRCIVEDERVRFEFELDLFNSGSAPARDVLIEAQTFNASPQQDRQIGAFFAQPVGKGERLPTIAPLKRVTLRPQVAVALDQVRVLEVAGRRVFVPLLAFNALYRWGGVAEGQTSAAYLIARDTKGEKMAPFRLDLGPRVFRGIGSRPLPLAVRK